MSTRSPSSGSDDADAAAGIIENINVVEGSDNDLSQEGEEEVAAFRIDEEDSYHADNEGWGWNDEESSDGTDSRPRDGDQELPRRDNVPEAVHIDDTDNLSPSNSLGDTTQDIQEQVEEIVGETPREASMFHATTRSKTALMKMQVKLKKEDRGSEA